MVTPSFFQRILNNLHFNFYQSAEKLHKFVISRLKIVSYMIYVQLQISFSLFLLILIFRHCVNHPKKTEKSIKTNSILTTNGV